MSIELIDVLYWDNTANRAGTDSEEVRTILDRIDSKLESFQQKGILDPKGKDDLYDMVLEVCSVHHKAGFIAGMKTAYALGKELQRAEVQRTDTYKTKECP